MKWVLGVEIRMGGYPNREKGYTKCHHHRLPLKFLTRPALGQGGAQTVGGQRAGHVLTLGLKPFKTGKRWSLCFELLGGFRILEIPVSIVTFLEVGCDFQKRCSICRKRRNHACLAGLQRGTHKEARPRGTFHSERP